MLINTICEIATFTDLSIDRAGGGCVLVATSGALVAAESQPFTVTPIAPAADRFYGQRDFTSNVRTLSPMA